MLTTQIDHFSDYIAGMTAVDGALVLTQQIDIVGFGVEIQATQVPLSSVYRALNVEGTSFQAVPADHGGTRHRAAYRLCLAAPECLAIVVSQDGNVQFVHNQDGQVVFWDQLSF
ncbi:DNA integrity scanning protein DisA nucleotide-binding domain protein [Hymenobacter sp. BRD128]|uniref:diadenylate cyclase n=1 Tax=Hymenobacter sp. BRD128 TaxID=2675878 RepID=UPI0015652543|nr:diadenylate cyclase [Hymenobacter sp. BRD128]QKG56320.1 DNA integrity scanning protein DisA nucleotide-binding domain protein [Hymenobacter sp. BRD128]